MKNGARLRRAGGLALCLAVLAFACLESLGQPPKRHSRASAATAEPSFATDVKPMLAKYCFGCHSGKDASAGLDLTKIVNPAAFEANEATWDKISERLAAQSMPPASAPRPTASATKRAVAWIELADKNLCKLADPGRVTIRRLNREEYNNTIRDLIGLDLHPADDFPSDDVGYGFDNIGDVLTISPLLMEKYIGAAEKVANAAIVVPGVHTRRYEALDMTEAPNSVSDDGGRLYYSNGESFKTVKLQVGGTYRFRAYAAGDLAGPDLPHMSVSLDGQHVLDFEVGVRRGHPSTYEAPLPIDAGSHKIGIAFTNDYYNTKEPKGQQDRNLWLGYFELTGPVDKSGTVSDAHLRIIPSQPSPDQVQATAREDLTNFATKAYRRPVRPEEVDQLIKVFAVGMKAGGTFEEGMKLGVEAALVSPEFLFRVELDPKALQGRVRPLNDYELASRLSYFLWSSMPDPELFELAKEGKLHRTEVLNAQVERMLEDPKSEALANNFAGQWLQLRKLAIVYPDPVRFPGVDDSMKADMATETKMFFDAVLHEHRSILDFIDGRYTFVNEKLAKLYGYPGVGGSGFQRIDLPPERGGVLSQASILTVTSNPTRTSPTKRGKWVLEQILGTPPPPPPPGVSQINDEQHRITATSLRQLMEEHRKNPMCAACHSKMDPIGFGLENYDAVGRWRTKDGNFDLDTSGILPDGRSFAGPQGLRQILLHDKDKFARALADKLLTYGLGRGTDAQDKCSLTSIVQQAARHNYKFDQLITAVIDSDPFRKRKGEVATR